jgi:hypothetical protein
LHEFTMVYTVQMNYLINARNLKGMAKRGLRGIIGTDM